MKSLSLCTDNEKIISLFFRAQNDALATKATTTALSAVDAKLALSGGFAKVSFVPTVSGTDVQRINLQFVYSSGSYYELKFFTGATKQIAFDYYGSGGTYARLWSGTLN